jgi:hypothetical protein
MARKTIRRTIDKSRSADYRKVAESLFGGADVAKEYEYWNAAGILIVHSAIAYSDAISIKFGGVKCQGEDHNQVISLLKELLIGSDENKKAFLQLEKIIAHKTSVSYSGDVYERKDVENLCKNILRFKTWAENLLD